MENTERILKTMFINDGYVGVIDNKPNNKITGNIKRRENIFVTKKK